MKKHIKELEKAGYERQALPNNSQTPAVYGKYAEPDKGPGYGRKGVEAQLWPDGTHRANRKGEGHSTSEPTEFRSVGEMKKALKEHEQHFWGEGK